MRRLAIAIIVFGFAALAYAQGVSDLQPAPPPAPAGTTGAYYPGMPLPAIPAPQERAPAGDRKKEPEGRILFGDDAMLEEPSGPVGPETPPDTVVVRKGDTLWGLSGTYLHDHWAWPKLWSWNPSITNPHWIYPGDLIHLAPPGQGTTPVATTPTEEPQRRIQVAPLPEMITLQQEGFVEPHELEDAGRIIGSKEEKTLLATLDEAYVQFHPEKPLKVGGRYSVYKPVRTVRHPVTGERLGEIVRIYGEVDVRSATAAHIASVQIVNSNDGIERKFYVGPLKREFRLPPRKPSARDQVGVIVAQLRELELIGAHLIVFIDRGYKDGVEVGNHFYITRRGDGYEPLLWHKGPVDDQRFPREDVGELVVLETRERLSTCLVIGTTKEARVGDRVETRRGQ